MIPATAARRCHTHLTVQVHVVGRPTGKAHLYIGKLTPTGQARTPAVLLCRAAHRKPVRGVDEWSRPLCNRCAAVVGRRFPEVQRDKRPEMPKPDPAVLEAAVAAASSIEQLESIDFEATVRGAAMWTATGTPKWQRDMVDRRRSLQFVPAPAGFDVPHTRRAVRTAQRAAEIAALRRTEENRAYGQLVREINAQPRGPVAS